MDAATMKNRIVETVQALPEDATVEDAMERLLFLAKLQMSFPTCSLRGYCALTPNKMRTPSSSRCPRQSLATARSHANEAWWPWRYRQIPPNAPQRCCKRWTARARNDEHLLYGRPRWQRVYDHRIRGATTPVQPAARVVAFERRRRWYARSYGQALQRVRVR
jgi:hypothetical protein